MYYAMVAALMAVLPIASIVMEMLAAPGAGLISLMGKWFVFWAVGVRLFTAGLKQIVQPEFTAKKIFEIDDPGALKVVSELGVSNMAIGMIGLLSIYFRIWIMPAALYGLIFYGLAGVRHLRNQRRNLTENAATVSDFWVAVILAVYIIGSTVA